MEVDEAINLGIEILGLCGEVPEGAIDFSESVQEKVEGIVSWIEEHHAVTDKQISALQNMKRGLEKWIR